MVLDIAIRKTVLELFAPDIRVVDLEYLVPDSPWSPLKHAIGLADVIALISFNVHCLGAQWFYIVIERSLFPVFVEIQNLCIFVLMCNFELCDSD